MKRKYIRLQGAEWHNKKDNLILFSYKINEYGRIKGFYKEKDRDDKKYSHWMNDKEIEEFNETHKPKVRTYTIPKEEFMIGDFKVIRDNRQCSFIYVGPTEPTDKKMKSYTEEDLLCFIHDLRRNWGDLKKWLEKQMEDRQCKNDFERYTAYENTLNKMIGLEGRK